MHETKREPSILKGVIAGFIGGIIATAAKAAAEKIYPPIPRNEPEAAALSVPPKTGTLSFKKETEVGDEAINWTFGALAGAVYGAVAEYYPEATTRGGVAFGMTLCTVTQEGIMPALRLTESSSADEDEDSAREHRSELATHIVYGIVAETVRRLARRAMD